MMVRVRSGTNATNMSNTSFQKVMEDTTYDEYDDEDESDKFGDALFSKMSPSKQMRRPSGTTTAQRLLSKQQELQNNNRISNQTTDELLQALGNRRPTGPSMNDSEMDFKPAIVNNRRDSQSICGFVII